MKQSLCLFVLLFSLVSCRTDLPLPAASGERKIALLGELAGDDTVWVRGGQSIPLSSSEGEPVLIKQLAVVLKDNGGVSTALQERQDFASPSLYTVPFSSATTIKPGGAYTLNATHPTLKSVSVSVAIPKAFQAKP